MGSASDRKKVEQAGRRERGARVAELDGVRYLMGSPVGRALVARLLDVTGTEKAPPFSANAMTMARDVGVQSVGYLLLAEIRQACPEQELIMRREAALLAQRADMQEELDNE